MFHVIVLDQPWIRALGVEAKLSRVLGECAGDTVARLADQLADELGALDPTGETFNGARGWALVWEARENWEEALRFAKRHLAHSMGRGDDIATLRILEKVALLCVDAQRYTVAKEAYEAFRDRSFGTPLWGPVEEEVLGQLKVSALSEC